jgi:hypothetical protein
VLYEQRRSPNEEFRALRPFWTERRQLDPPESRATFLWPLGMSRSNREGAMCRLFPLHVRYVRHRTAGTASTGVTLGLLLTGNSPETGPYAALFPFGGSLRQWWLKERIDFVLFPAWVHTHEGRSDSYSVVWPFFSVSKGSVQGWRLWPFYGHYRRTTRDGRPMYDRRFILWPFWIDHRDQLDHEQPTHTRFSALFGRIEGATVTDRTWLFPFFRHRIDRGEHPREDWRMPFPFVQVGDGAEYRRRDYWPIYGTRRIGAARRTFWLWPFVREERRETPGDSERRLYVMPFYWSLERRAAGRLTASNRKIWPLYQHRRRRDGSVVTEVPSPLWYEDRYGVEALLSPFWRLWGRDRAADGRETVTAAFGLYRSARHDGGTPADWQVLGGLVGRESVDGRRRTRWLFLRPGGRARAPGVTG